MFTPMFDLWHWPKEQQENIITFSVAVSKSDHHYTTQTTPKTTSSITFFDALNSHSRFVIENIIIYTYVYGL